MGAPSKYRLFISAVSKELGAERREVARVLMRKGLELREQEYFTAGPGTLLDKLDRYIANCDAVIFLIGTQSGFGPTGDQVKACSASKTFEDYRQASGAASASYTQWEYLLAQHHGRDCYVFVAGKELAPPAEADDGQRAYRSWLVKEGKDWSPFESTAKLIEDVLVLDFPDIAHAIPDNLPFQPLGSLFKGREAAMDELEDIFEKPSGAVASAALHGLGGVGKTRLAVEYAHAHRGNCTALLFLIAETPESLSRTLAGLAAVLDLPQKEAREDEVKIGAVMDWLAGNPGWLLILDNVDDETTAKAATQLLDQLRGGHVLITGRFAKYKAGIRKVELSTLKPKAGAAYLLEATEASRVKASNDDAMALKLAKDLDGLAVALEQAAAYMNVQRLGFARYLEIWAKARDAVLGWHDDAAMNYPKSVAATWLASTEKLSSASRLLLDRFAWFSPEPIPDFLMDVSAPGIEPTQIREALTGLFTYSLAQRGSTTGNISVHRLVQDVTRSRLEMTGSPASLSSLSSALIWISLAFIGDWKDVGFSRSFKLLLQHLNQSHNHAISHKIVEPIFPPHDAVAEFSLKRPTSEAKVRFFERLGFGLPDIAVIFENLGEG